MCISHAVHVAKFYAVRTVLRVYADIRGVALNLASSSKIALGTVAGRTVIQVNWCEVIPQSGFGGTAVAARTSKMQIS